MQSLMTADGAPASVATRRKRTIGRPRAAHAAVLTLRDVTMFDFSDGRTPAGIPCGPVPIEDLARLFKMSRSNAHLCIRRGRALRLAHRS